VNPRGRFFGARASKFGAKPTYVDGIRFASKKEARRYEALKLLERAGVIRDLERQPRFPIVINGEPVKIRSHGSPNGRAVYYVADFRYFDTRENARIVEDVKGIPKPRPQLPTADPRLPSKPPGMGSDTDVARLKRALVESIYGIRVRII